jgi:hypothetical protein
MTLVESRLDLYEFWPAVVAKLVEHSTKNDLIKGLNPTPAGNQKKKVLKHYYFKHIDA